VNVTRIYADERGESRFADCEVELRDAGPIGRLSEPIPARSVILRKNDPGYDYTWHVAPQRQFIVLLDGAIEVETSDGIRRTFRGGDILLMEDAAGKGHRTRNVEPRERRRCSSYWTKRSVRPRRTVRAEEGGSEWHSSWKASTT
jgi:hypothetical protein